MHNCYGEIKCIYVDVACIMDICNNRYLTLCFLLLCLKPEDCGPCECTCNRQAIRSCCLQSELICAVFIQRRWRKRRELIHYCHVNFTTLTIVIIFKETSSSCLNFLLSILETGHYRIGRVFVETAPRNTAQNTVQHRICWSPTTAVVVKFR